MVWLAFESRDEDNLLSLEAVCKVINSPYWHAAVAKPMCSTHYNGLSILDLHLFRSFPDPSTPRRMKVILLTSHALGDL